MISAVRVDHRLIHGQVAFSWTHYLGADCILIASDDILNNQIKMTAMKMAKPHGVKLVIKGIDDSIKALNSGVTDKYRLFILCESVADVYKLAKQVKSIKKINLGGTKDTDSRVNISKAVFVSKDDIEKLKELDSLGIEVSTQLVPDDLKTNVIDLL